MKTSNILLSVLGSAFVGALLGVLFAPDKGTKTRKQIVKKSDEYADTAKKEYDEFVDKMGKQYEYLRKQSDDLISRGGTKAAEIKENLKKSVS